MSFRYWTGHTSSSGWSPPFTVAGFVSGGSGAGSYPFGQLAGEMLHGVNNVDLHEVHCSRKTLFELGQINWIVLEIGLQMNKISLVLRRLQLRSHVLNCNAESIRLYQFNII